MAELQAIIEAASMAKGAGELIGEKRKKGKKASNMRFLTEEEEYSDVREEAPKVASSKRAPKCYAAALGYMEELTQLQTRVDYSLRVADSKALQLAERAKAAAYG